MDPVITAALVSAGTNIFGIGQARKAYHRSKKLMDKQFGMAKDMYDYQNEYNLPSSQMARLKAAGLNPALMYGQGTTGNANNYPQPKYTELSPYFKGSDAASVQNAASSLALLKQNKDLMKADMFKKYSEMNLNKTNEFKIQSMLGLEMDKMSAEIEFTKANTSLTRVTSELNSAKIGLTLDQRKQVQAQVEQVFKNIEVQNKMLEMDYSDITGKNWMVNAEKLFGGQYDLSTYLGAASMIASLSILKNPKTAGKVTDVAVKSAQGVAKILGYAKTWFNRTFRNMHKK